MQVAERRKKHAALHTTNLYNIYTQQQYGKLEEGEGAETKTEKSQKISTIPRAYTDVMSRRGAVLRGGRRRATPLIRHYYIIAILISRNS